MDLGRETHSGGRSLLIWSPDGSTSWLDTVRRSTPSARIEIVIGVGYFPQLEAPHGVNRLIETFVAELPDQGRSA
jgi:hypothetical protein